MRRNSKRIDGLNGMELFEEAAHLLRQAPLGLWLRYYLGAAPFVLGLLFFWADMSRNTWAEEHLVGASLGLAALFVWMKCWQAVFVAGLRAHLAGEPQPEWDRPRVLRMIAVQSSLQPLGFLLLPVTLVTVIFFPPTFSFFQSLTVTGSGDIAGIRAAASRATRLGSLWPGLNFMLVALGALAAFMLFINVAALLGLFPHLVRIFLGIESTFTRAGSSAILNTTFLAAVAGVAWLLLDPVLKSVWLLRCFYAESVQSGEDLRVSLNRAVARTRAVAGALALMIGLMGPMRLTAGEARPPSPKPAPAALPSQELDRSIEEVLRRAEYSWRLPRERMAEARPETWWTRFLKNVADQLESLRVWVMEKINQSAKWLRGIMDKLFPNRSTNTGAGTAWVTGVNTLAFLLLAIALSALAILILRLWKQRQKRIIVAAEAIAATPDLNDENTAADQLPEDGWLKLAQDMMQQGNLRLALRALYLASLAHLAHREVVRIARFKTNHEYEREVRRRARALPELQDAFGRNVGRIDRAWYGLHEVTGEQLGEFREDVERIRSIGAPAEVKR